jgi:hypothetical protein
MDVVGEGMGREMLTSADTTRRRWGRAIARQCVERLAHGVGAGAGREGLEGAHLCSHGMPVHWEVCSREQARGAPGEATLGLVIRYALLLAPSSSSLTGPMGSSSLSHRRTTSFNPAAADWRSGRAQPR